MDLFNTAELNDAKIKVNPNHLQPNCKKCDLNKAPKIEVSGEGKKEILVIGESTLNEEMTYGSAFVDDTGFLLNKILRKQNISLNKDCWKINAVKCYSHIKTNHKQINCCRPALEKLIYKLKPKTILLCGDVAVTSLFGEDFSNRSIFRWRMYCIPDEKYKCNIIPILHPRYVLDNDKDSGMYRQYERDVTKACYLMKRPFLKNKKYESYVTVVTDFTKLKRILTKVIKNKTKIAYDYETTGLKPYRNRQKIVTIAFAVSMTKAFAFPFDYKTFWTEKERNEIYTLWQTILRDNKINKIAYNEKFEKIWSMEIFKAKPKCFFDPMIVLHILDNRSGILGLKFQTFVNYGVRPYDKHIQKYLKSKKASDYNSVEEAPFNDLLIYNGLDCIFTYMLYDELMGKLGKNSELLSAYNFFIRGLDIMAIMQHNGIPASADYYEQTDVYLHEKIQRLETELMTGREATKFKEKYKRDIKIKSNQDLGKLFYEILGKPAIKTSKGNYKTDKPTLETLKLPFVDKLLDIKKYEKAKGTYLGQFKREIVSNKIHPFFNLHLPVSYRSCIAKGTNILVMRDFEKHPNGVPIESVKKGDMVYCFDDKLKPQIKKVLWAGKTGHKEVIRLHWYRKGKKGYLDCTPEHRIRLITGKYIEAQYLLDKQYYKKKTSKSANCSVLACGRSHDKLRFTGHLKYGKGIHEHRFIYEKLIGDLTKKEVVHHKNRNHLDHTPYNLEKLTPSAHSKIHIQYTLLTKESRKKNIKAIKEGWKNGNYANSIKRGSNHPQSLNLTKDYCLNILHACSGKTKKTADTNNIDFGTFKKYLKLHNIDEKAVQLVYDKNNNFISEKRLQILSKLGRSKVQKILGHNYYKLKKLYNLYNIDTKRRWGNQFGTFVPGNHTITKIEWLDKTTDVYDIEVQDCHNFFANEICVHNSASSPSFQNIPKRDPEVSNLVRKGLFAPKNCIISETDFSGSEIIGSASCHRDPTFIHYLQNPETDMHRDCYSFDTKILTENGFKYYNEINDNEKVAQYNSNIDKIEYVSPLKRICYDYNGDMHYMRTNYIDVFVTPNHRLYLKKIHKTFEIVKAKDIKRYAYYSKTGADIVEKIELSNFHFKAVYGIGVNKTKKYHDAFTIEVDDMFELLGYLITDGHFKYHKQGTYRINLSQKKEYHKSIMKTCIDRIKLYTNFKFHEAKDMWSMSNKSFCTWLCDNFGVNKTNRKLPVFIKQAPLKQLKIFFDACMLGDGTFHKSKNSGTLYTVSTDFIDDFQFICMRLGYCTRIRKLKLKGDRTIQVYAICFIMKSECRVKAIPPFVGTEKYEGKVFCFTVSSGLLVTQRNNKISIQGNCAEDIWQLPKDMLNDPNYNKEQKKKAKMIRFFAKNNWTFAQFYGDWFLPCGTNLWENVINGNLELPTGQSVLDYTNEKGIYELGEIIQGVVTPGSFLDHLKKVEKKMWYDRFPQYTQWKNDIYEQYQDYGYIENHFGFRFTGYMSKNQCCNYPIQSVSFHLLLDSLIVLYKSLRKHKMKTKLIGQIHDSCLAIVPENEIVTYHTIVHDIIANLHNKFKWMVVPMDSEIEISKLGKNGGNFTEMSEISITDIQEGKYKAII